MFSNGFMATSTVHSALNATNATPKATAITAVTTMSLVRHLGAAGAAGLLRPADIDEHLLGTPTPSPGDDGVERSSLLPSPVRAGSGSAGLWPAPHSQRCCAPRRRV